MSQRQLENGPVRAAGLLIERDRPGGGSIVEPKPLAVANSRWRGAVTQPALGQADVASPGAGVRLIVLVPDCDIDETGLARLVIELAAPNVHSLIFLGLCRNGDGESSMRRRMAMLAALTRDGPWKIQTGIEFGADWIPGIKRRLRAGDTVLWHAEQRTGIWRKPLGRGLEVLGVTVWTVRGLYDPPLTALRNPLQQTLFWITSLLTLTVFFWLQAQLVRLPGGGSLTGLLSVSVLIEIGVLWSLNELTA